jgi:hypothetical protein
MGTLLIASLRLDMPASLGPAAGRAAPPSAAGVTIGARLVVVPPSTPLSPGAIDALPGAGQKIEFGAHGQFAPTQLGPASASGSCSSLAHALSAASAKKPTARPVRLV